MKIIVNNFQVKEGEKAVIVKITVASIVKFRRLFSNVAEKYNGSVTNQRIGPSDDLVRLVYGQAATR